MNRDTQVLVRCLHCNEDNTFAVNADDLARWGSGTLVQEAFPYLDAAERELLVSETCDSCWNKIWWGEL